MVFLTYWFFENSLTRESWIHSSCRDAAQKRVAQVWGAPGRIRGPTMASVGYSEKVKIRNLVSSFRIKSCFKFQVIKLRHRQILVLKYSSSWSMRRSWGETELRTDEGAPSVTGRRRASLTQYEHGSPGSLPPTLCQLVVPLVCSPSSAFLQGHLWSPVSLTFSTVYSIHLFVSGKRT